MKTIDQAKQICDSDKELLAELKRIVIEHIPDATLFLYGSAARGERGPESDYDVLVLLNTPISTSEEDEVDSRIYALELDRGAVISMFFVTRDQWDRFPVVVSPYRRNVDREAVLL